MFKMLILSAIIIGALIIGGVIDVQVHTDQLAQVPGRVLGVISQKSTIEEARAMAIKLKRQGEQAITKDESQKFKLALIYMEADADRLQELADKNTDTAEIVPQAQLLSESVDRVRQLGEDVPVEALTKEHNTSREAFTKAQGSLEKLETLRAEHADLQAQFERITQSVSDNLRTGEIAGAKDTPEEAVTPTPKPLNGVPLKF